MTDYEPLIARLKAAETGNSELSWAIAEALGWTRYWSMMTIYLPPGETEEFANEHPEDSGATVEMPRFTTSIDEALTLVPSGAVWHVMTDYGDLNRAKIGPRENPSASVYQDGGPPLFIQADAATPALALCIAALMAQAAIAVAHT